MPLFHVTFTKEIEITVEADSREECEEAAEAEACDRELNDYQGEWEYSVVEAIGGGIADTGVNPDGSLAHIDDARREKRTARLRSVGRLKCPHCETEDDAREFVIAHKFRDAIVSCPDCGKGIDPDAVLDGDFTVGPVAVDDERTLTLFEDP